MGDSPCIVSVLFVEGLILYSAQGLNNGLMTAVTLREEVGHAFGNAHGHTGGADVLTHADVFEPTLLLLGLFCCALEEGGIKKWGHVVFGQKVTDEAAELLSGFAVVGAPIFYGTNPVGVVVGELLKCTDEGIDDRVAISFECA